MVQSRTKPRSQTTTRTRKPIKVLVAHDNRTPLHTTKSHNFARRLDKDPRFRVLHDQKKWKRGEKTSANETNRREKEMVKEADIIFRNVPAPSKTYKKRNKGALREVRKGIYRGKPVIENYESGARQSPNRLFYEKNYKKRVVVHQKPGERLMTGFLKGLKELKKKKIIK